VRYVSREQIIQRCNYRSQAIASARRLAQFSQIEAVLVGDGWQIFHYRRTYLQELIDRIVINEVSLE
jgi:Metallo-beta-lactamase superfamily